MYQFIKRFRELPTAPATPRESFLFVETGGQPYKLTAPTIGGSVPAAVAAYVAARHVGVGLVNQTTLTLTALPQTVVDATEYQGDKIWTFPEGRILVLGAVATLAQTTTSILADTLNASSTGAVGVGTTTATATTLATTTQNLIPTTAFTSSATINVAGTAVSAPLAASAQFDGTTTAVVAFLNSAFATTANVDADATMTWTGTVKLTWINLGDY